MVTPLWAMGMMNFEPNVTWLPDLPEGIWLLLGKTVGAIAGSAISIAYVLPAGRREAFIRFCVGLTVGLVFGTAVGLKLADLLGVADRISVFEITLSGAAFASLSAWWGLGMLKRLISTVKPSVSAT